MRQHRSGHGGRQGGYSLAEALVVVAIIGIISVVAVPNFIALYRASKVKGAALKFANDLRGARQRAATTYRPVMVSVGTSTDEKGFYWIASWDGSAWVGSTRRELEAGVPEASKTTFFRFPGANAFTDAVGSDGRPDIIFETNGGTRTTPTNPFLYVETNIDLPKSSYTIRVNSAGTVLVE
jgi:prepilin-type N-terminal cleavage/methylation domain-containing protein